MVNARCPQSPAQLAHQGKKLREGYNAIAATLGLGYTRCVGFDCRSMVTFDPGPVPLTEARSTPLASATLRATGVALTSWELLPALVPVGLALGASPDRARQDMGRGRVTQFRSVPIPVQRFSGVGRMPLRAGMKIPKYRRGHDVVILGGATQPRLSFHQIARA